MILIKDKDSFNFPFTSGRGPFLSDEPLTAGADLVVLSGELLNKNTQIQESPLDMDAE